MKTYLIIIIIASLFLSGFPEKKELVSYNAFQSKNFVCTNENTFSYTPNFNASSAIKNKKSYIFSSASNNSYECINSINNINAQIHPLSMELKPGSIESNASIFFNIISLHKGEESLIENLEHVAVQNKGSKIIYNINKKVDIEYINSESGIRQNFIVHNQPEGFDKLQLDINLICSTHPILADNNLMFINDFSDQFLPVCSYADLKVWDANGNILKAEMQLKPSIEENSYLLSLVVNDDNALYPITIDPISNGVSDWSVTTYQSGSLFGSAVGNGGDINGDGFDDVVVGANSYNNAYIDGGRVYVYFGSVSGPVTTPSQTIDGVGTSGFFGKLVNTAGDVNGDGFDETLIRKSSTTYLYYGSAAGLVSATILSTGVGSGNVANYFGPAGDINGDSYDDVLWASYDTDNGFTNEGKVAVWLGSAAGIIATPHRIYEGEQTNAQLGFSAASGDLNGDGYSDIAFSANKFDNGQTDEGIVYVCYGSSGGLNAVPDWSREGNKINAAAGYSISCGDINNDGFDELGIAIPKYDDSTSYEGLVELYYGQPTGISETNVYRHYYYSTVASDYSFLNLTADLNGDNYNDMLYGDILTDNARPGTYAIFPGGPNGILNESAFRTSAGLIGNGDYNNDGKSDLLKPGTEIATLVNGSTFFMPPDIQDYISGSQSNALFGNAVSSAGDVNNDGFDDIIIGSPEFDSTYTNEGKVELYLGDGSGEFGAPVWVKYGQQANAKFGYSVSAAGDVNGDGFDDILIGTPLFDNLYIDEGRIQIYYGGSSGINNFLFPATRYSYQAGAQLGFSVSDAGDVNNDGYNDFIAGAPYYDKGSLDEGVAYIYIGSPVSPSFSPIWVGESNQASAYYGMSVSGGGNINGDIYDDIAVGAPYFNKAGTNNGQVYIYHGKSTGVSSFANFTKSVVSEYYQGQSIAIDGDLNNDGYDDLIYASDDKYYAFTGSGTGINSTPIWSGEGIGYNATSINTRLVSYCNDIDGDSYDDIMVTSSTSSMGSYSEGVTYLLHGNMFGLTPSYSDVYEGNRTFANFGADVDCGDFNGDGFGDLIIGAPKYLDNDVFTGRSYFYFGSGISCSDISGLSSSSTVTSASITWVDDPDAIWYGIRWRLAGETIWMLDSVSTSSFNLNSLDTCTTYEFQIQAVCATGSSAWSPITSITTTCFDPCATAPSGLFTTDLTSTSAKAHWDAVPGVTSYKIWYRPVGAGSWTKKSSTINSKNLPGLSPATNYEYKVQSVCGAITSPFSSVMNFNTLPRLGSPVAGIEFYPNPAHDFVTILIPENMEVTQIYIYDVTGKTVLSISEPQLNDGQINVYLEKSLAYGLYYLEVQSIDTKYTRVIIKN